ncbi:MAG: murein biosynthesis integral membrane protein MurJ [Syntrophorhabdaceae bacterium]
MDKPRQITKVFSIQFILWVIFYCYSTFAAIMFQKVLLPLFPAYAGGSGLIGGGDSVFFHRIAVKLADAIRQGGWSQWTLRPVEGATGNVSLLAALYAVFGVDPLVIIPVNCALHATSGLLIFLISRELWPGKVGIYAGIITASLFVAFPSSLNWYAQIHKDGFAVLGMLLIFYSWLKGIHSRSKIRLAITIILGTLVGGALVVFVRPYNIMLFMMSASVIGIFLFFHYLFRKKIKHAFKVLSIFIIFIAIFSVGNSFMPQMFIVKNKQMVLTAFRVQGIDWTWHKSEVLPDSVDRLLENTALVRMTNIYHGKLVKAGSIIDENVMPRDASTVLAYIPRAAFVGLFAPFPNSWFSKRSMIRLVSAGEMMIWYALIPGIFLTFWYRRSIDVTLMALNALVFLTVLGFTVPIVGTLYRFRYVYLFIFIMLGMMGWLELIRRNYRKIIKHIPFPDYKPQENMQPMNAMSVNGRTGLAAAGFTVISFTLLSNILLVARDVVLARWFGLSNELDAFFIAMIVPMFLVTVLSIPIGTVVIPHLIQSFEKDSHEATQKLITVCSTMILCLMVFLSLVLYISGKYYLPLIGWGFSPGKIALSHRILMIIMPILFFSGFVILGNSILNARRKFAVPALAQAVVPMIAIVALIAAASRIGIYAMAAGMILGQIVNLVLVDYYVRKEGYSLFPAISPSRIFQIMRISRTTSKSMFWQYVPLVIAALFISLSLPINNVMAASLAAGSVSAFNLGMKFILFFTGLVGTGISTVMLPHFAQYFAQDRITDVKGELSFFLVFSTIVPIPLTIALFMLASPIVKLIFYGGLFTVSDLTTVTRIMEYGSMQMPFFCANMILVKYANARRKNTLITISSILGLCANIVLNFLFIRTMGVAGIALAISLSMVLATGLLVVAGYRYGDISAHDITFMILAWLLYLTMFLYFYYGNILGIIATSAILCISISIRCVILWSDNVVGKRPAWLC